MVAWLPAITLVEDLQFRGFAVPARPVRADEIEERAAWAAAGMEEELEVDLRRAADRPARELEVTQPLLKELGAHGKYDLEIAGSGRPDEIGDLPHGPAEVLQPEGRPFVEALEEENPYLARKRREDAGGGLGGETRHAHHREGSHEKVGRLNFPAGHQDRLIRLRVETLRDVQQEVRLATAGQTRDQQDGRFTLLQKDLDLTL